MRCQPGTSDTAEGRGSKNAEVQAVGHGPSRNAPKGILSYLSGYTAAGCVDRMIVVQRAFETALAGTGHGRDTDVLARGSRRLAGSLSLDHLVGRLLDFLVPEFVPFAKVSIADAGAFHRAASRSVDDEAMVWTRWRPPEEGRRSVSGVMVSGRRALLPAVAQDDLPALVPPAVRGTVDRFLPAKALVLPLAAGGSVFGTLTLLGPPDGSVGEGTDPRVWEELAERAALAFQSARLYQERHEALDVLQRDLYPPDLPRMEGLDVATFYRAADAARGLGGDFYDVHGEEGEWTVVLGDVAGKGVGAAVLAGRARQVIRTAALVNRRPARVLELLNRVLVSSAQPEDERFLTAVCVRLQPMEGLRWAVDVASAGHPSPMVLRQDGRVDPAAATGPLAGVLPDATYQEETVMLETGETLLLFTDGVTETRDAGGEQFGVPRVADALAALVGAEAEAVVSYVARCALEWEASSRQDDVALLAIRVDHGKGRE